MSHKHVLVVVWTPIASLSTGYVTKMVGDSVSVHRLVSIVNRGTHTHPADPENCHLKAEVEGCWLAGEIVKNKDVGRAGELKG